MRRADRVPAGRWIREAWLADDALRIVALQYQALTGREDPTLTALRAGGRVTARMWELPDVVADRLRAEGCPIDTVFCLTEDDELEVVG